jgi:predicted transcriptional regulator
MKVQSEIVVQEVDLLKTFNRLLFELSSLDRLNILFLLKKTPMKLSHISSKLDFTVQETSRNITRLSDAKLIIKDVDGSFHLTPYGEEVLNLLSGYSFLFENRGYFAAHKLVELPKMFRASLGVLDGCEVVNEVMVAFHNVEKMIINAEEFVWILTDQVLASTIPYLTKAIERGVKFRLLMPKDYIPSNDVRELVDNPIFEKASRSGKLENRFLETIDVFLCLSEKEVASMAFPTLKGVFDYTGFRAKNESVLEWSKTVFTYYWNKAVTQIPEQLRQVNDR